MRKTMGRRMDQAAIKEQPVAVLEHIQSRSGEECPPLDGELRPAESLPEFNSKVWAVAAGMLSAAIGEPIPPEANIFFDETTKQPLTVDQTVARVCRVLEEQKARATAA